MFGILLIYQTYKLLVFRNFRILIKKYYKTWINSLIINIIVANEKIYNKSILAVSNNNYIYKKKLSKRIENFILMNLPPKCTYRYIFLKKSCN